MNSLIFCIPNTSVSMLSKLVCEGNLDISSMRKMQELLFHARLWPCGKRVTQTHAHAHTPCFQAFDIWYYIISFPQSLHMWFCKKKRNVDTTTHCTIKWTVYELSSMNCDSYGFAHSASSVNDLYTGSRVSIIWRLTNSHSPLTLSVHICLLSKKTYARVGTVIELGLTK